MNKICTSQEQSKKLLELGVDVNTADMTYVSMKDYGENTYHLTVGKTDVNWAKDELGNLNWNDVYEKYIPAWSLAALRACLPPGINIDGILYVFECHKTFDNMWVYEYKFEDISAPLYSKSSNEIDAAVEMIIQLKENKMI